MIENPPIKAVLFDLDDTLLDGKTAQNKASSSAARLSSTPYPCLPFASDLSSNHVYFF